jgi:hypothetical protein
MGHMTQAEWDKTFENIYPIQPTLMPEMKQEYNMIRTIVCKECGLTVRIKDIIAFWEAYSNSMDGSWLSATQETIRREVCDFLYDPKDWFNRHPLPRG